VHGLHHAVNGRSEQLLSGFGVETSDQSLLVSLDGSSGDALRVLGLAG
jgi:hypothetical protein